MDFRANLGEEIAGTLRQLGLDPAGEHPLQFYFYFPAEAAARAVAALKMAAAFNAGDNPSAFAALSGMGASLAKLGRFDEAVKVYQRSIAAKPDFAETHLNLTLAYAELGRTTDVLKTLRTAIALDMRMKDRARQAIELQGLRGNAEFDALVGKGV